MNDQKWKYLCIQVQHTSLIETKNQIIQILNYGYSSINLMKTNHWNISINTFKSIIFILLLFKPIAVYNRISESIAIKPFHLALV